MFYSFNPEEGKSLIKSIEVVAQQCNGIRICKNMSVAHAQQDGFVSGIEHHIEYANDFLDKYCRKEVEEVVIKSMFDMSERRRRLNLENRLSNSQNVEGDFVNTSYRTEEEWFKSFIQYCDMQIKLLLPSVSAFNLVLSNSATLFDLVLCIAAASGVQRMWGDIGKNPLYANHAVFFSTHIPPHEPGERKESKEKEYPKCS